MTQYYLGSRTRKYVKGYGFLSFGRNMSNICGKQLLDNATITGPGCSKDFYQKVAHKATEATGEFIGKKIADKIVKPKPVFDMNSRMINKYLFHKKKETKC